MGDFFRERRRREAEEEEARRRRERKEQEEQQRQVAAQQAAQRRQEWRDEWISYAQQARPRDAPESIEIDIVEQVDRTLETLDPSRDYAVVQRSVDAVIKRALEPWARTKEIKEGIDRVLFRAEIDCRMMEEPEWRARAQD